MKTPEFSSELRLALTPAGVLYAFSAPQPDATQAALQSVLAHHTLPVVKTWLDQSPSRVDLLDEAMSYGWLHRVQRSLPAPDLRMEDFLPHVIGSLSGTREAALASTGGFCVGHTGFSQDKAEALCVAAADFTGYSRRQRTRTWLGANRMVSFHEDITMLMPSISFIPFWVDNTDFCLIVAGEPLLNNPALVELVWGIQSSGMLFSEKPRLIG